METQLPQSRSRTRLLRGIFRLVGLILQKLSSASWRFLTTHVLLKAHPLRAILDTVVLGSAFLLILTPNRTQIDLETLIPVLSSLLPLSLSGALVYALRLRLPQGSRLRKLKIEIFSILGLVLTLSVLLGAFLWVVTQQDAVQSQTFEVEADTIAINEAVRGAIVFVFGLLTTVTFVIYRIGIRLILRLERLRKRHLRWALTHAYLATLSGITLVPVLIMMLLLWSQLPNTLPAAPPALIGFALRVLYAILLPLSLFAAETIIFFLVVLPPIALISHFIARRITRRLELLVQATRALSDGRYNARVIDMGDDEIGQLQTHFNIMAEKLEHAMHELEDKQKRLEAEQAKSERLLLNILPPVIAARLKAEEHTIADSFAEATVLFSDIVDFTSFSSTLSPEQLVAWLNEVFSAFDQLAEKYGLEKIKTVGDAYMVVGGLPDPRPDHAEAMAEMALAMREELANHPAPDGTPLRMRIGMHTGQVVAGVIGTKKFIYDLWGDTVNTASRMESHGVGGGIQVTAATYELLRQRYHLEQRGLIDIKGKGAMMTYLLLGQRDENQSLNTF